jgi:hypothetical protein
MPAVEIRGGVKVEIPNREEIRDDIRDVWDARERDKARGVKWLDFTQPVSAAATTSTLIAGPEEGYSWSGKVLALTLAAAGTVAVYKASSTGQVSRPLAQPVTSVAVNGINVAVFTWSSNQGYLQHGQALYVQASATINTWYLACEQAVAEMGWKIFD